MKYTTTRIVYEDNCWFIPQYRWWGIWFNYEVQDRGSNMALRAQFFELEDAKEFIENCRMYNTYKGPK